MTTTDPTTIGSETDTVTDRCDHTPAERFERQGCVLYCVKANGTRYAWAASKQVRSIARPIGSSTTRGWPRPSSAGWTRTLAPTPEKSSGSMGENPPISRGIPVYDELGGGNG
jgi:hypothetical protein